jgi:hypothetical protein
MEVSSFQDQSHELSVPGNIHLCQLMLGMVILNSFACSTINALVKQLPEPDAANKVLS